MCSKLRSSWLKNEPLLVSSRTHKCAEASIINAAWVMFGEVEALSVAWAFERYGEELFVVKLSQLVSYIHKTGAGVQKFELRRCNHRVEITKVGEVDEFQWLAEKTDGIYLVRLEDKGEVHHIVCVDCRKGKRMILDNEEPFPIALSSKNLRLCGYPSSNVRVAEIREVVEKKG